MKKIVFGASLIFTMFSQFATASIVLLEDNRSAQSSINYVYGGQSSNNIYAPQVPFSSWTATANLPNSLTSYTLQSSAIANDFMSGSGMGMQGYESDMMSGYGYQYSSYFSVNFRVDTTQSLQLDGTLKAFANQCCDGTALSLVGSQGTIIGALVQGVSSTAAGDVTDYSGNGLLNLSRTITLAPGEYTLSVGTSYPYVDGKPSTGGNWAFTASFSNDVATVPLPSTIWLFASALGLGLRRIIVKR